MSALHPEVAAMLEAQLASGAKPRAQMTVEETRQAMLRGRDWQQTPVSVAVRDTKVNGIPVRLYGEESAQALLFLHGGRFFSGDLESHDWPLRLLTSLAKRRICAVDYRLAPEHRHPAALEDAVAAGRWLSGQTDWIVIGGDSAGGYLAAAAALELAPQWQMLIYPMLDPAGNTGSYREFATGPWPNGEDMRRGWELFGGAALAAESGAFPPTLLITAGIDPLRDEALAFGAALAARAIRVEAIHFPDMHHGFFTQTKLTRSLELMRLLAARLASPLPFLP